MDISRTDATALDALRVAEAHAAEAVAAAAAVSAALAADDALADAVADARSRGVSFLQRKASRTTTFRGQKKTDATVAETSLVAAAWSALAAGALSASRCVAERVFDSDASSHVEHAHARSIDIDIDASGRRVGKQTCFFAVVSGATGPPRRLSWSPRSARARSNRPSVGERRRRVGACRPARRERARAHRPRVRRTGAWTDSRRGSFAAKKRARALRGARDGAIREGRARRVHVFPRVDTRGVARGAGPHERLARARRRAPRGCGRVRAPHRARARGGCVEEDGKRYRNPSRLAFGRGVRRARVRRVRARV